MLTFPSQNYYYMKPDGDENDNYGVKSYGDGGSYFYTARYNPCGQTEIPAAMALSQIRWADNANKYCKEYVAVVPSRRSTEKEVSSYINSSVDSRYRWALVEHMTCGGSCNSCVNSCNAGCYNTCAAKNNGCGDCTSCNGCVGGCATTCQTTCQGCTTACTGCTRCASCTGCASAST